MAAASPSPAPIHIDDVPEQRWEAGEIAATRRRLGAAAGATRLGVAIIEVPPGARSTPPHSHADEEEVFLVLAGSGLSWQSSGSRDARTYAIGVDDVIVHPANGDAHTLIAGDDGLTVLVVAEGSRTNITYLPRTKMFWLGPRWSPADAPPPFQADADAGPLPVPEPTAQRPSSIVALGGCDVHTTEHGAFGTSYRDPGRAAGAERLVLTVDDLPAGRRVCPRHWHTVREECFYVLGGSGSAIVGDEAHPIASGSFFLRRPDSGVGQTIEAGPDGLRYVTMGDLLPGDLCHYPDSNKVKLGRGVFVRIDPLGYYDGEPGASP